MGDRTYGLGIDVGTTFTAAAVALAGNRTEVVSLGEAAPAIPTTLFLQYPAEALIGEPAARRALTNPEGVAREFKRRFGDSVPMMLSGTPYPVEALYGILLRAVVARVTERQGGVPAAVVLSHPAAWGTYKLDLLRDAARRAGLADALLLSEPECVAHQYATGAELADGDAIGIYDLGGGTFDATIVARDGDAFRIVGRPEGLERLGGVDVDLAILGVVQRSVPELDNLDGSDDPQMAAVAARLRADCIDAKHALSSDTVANVPVYLPTGFRDVRLNRTEVEHLIAPLLDETLNAFDRALASAAMTPDQLRAIVLAGGSARIPLVGQLLASRFGRQLAVDLHPKLAVATGAARVAAEAAGISARPVVAPRPAMAPASGPEPGVEVEAGAEPEVEVEVEVGAEAATPGTIGATPGTAGSPAGSPPLAAVPVRGPAIAEPDVAGEPVPTPPAAAAEAAAAAVMAPLDGEVVPADDEAPSATAPQAPAAPVAPPGPGAAPAAPASTRGRLLTGALAAALVATGPLMAWGPFRGSLYQMAGPPRNLGIATAMIGVPAITLASAVLGLSFGVRAALRERAGLVVSLVAVAASAAVILVVDPTSNRWFFERGRLGPNTSAALGFALGQLAAAGIYELIRNRNWAAATATAQALGAVVTTGAVRLLATDGSTRVSLGPARANMVIAPPRAGDLSTLVMATGALVLLAPLSVTLVGAARAVTQPALGAFVRQWRRVSAPVLTVTLLALLATAGYEAGRLAHVDPFAPIDHGVTSASWALGLSFGLLLAIRERLGWPYTGLVAAAAMAVLVFFDSGFPYRAELPLTGTDLPDTAVFAGVFALGQAASLGLYQLLRSRSWLLAGAAAGGLGVIVALSALAAVVVDQGPLDLADSFRLQQLVAGLVMVGITLPVVGATRSPAPPA